MSARPARPTGTLTNGAIDTRLHKAAEAGDDAAVSLLLAGGMDPNARDGWRGNAMHAAAFGGHASTVKILAAAGTNPSTADCFGEWPRHIAASRGHRAAEAACAAAERAAAADRGRRLRRAAAEGDTAAIAEALAKGANVDARGSNGKSALIHAVEAEQAEAVEALLAAGADPSQADDDDGGDGNTPLHCSWGSPEMAALLLAHGADAAATNASGDTALHAAVALGCRETVEVLLAADGERNRMAIHIPSRNNGMSPLHTATVKGDEFIVSALLEHGADVRQTDTDGSTSLHLAVRKCQTGVAVLLVRAGADVDARDGDGHSARDLADGGMLAEIDEAARMAAEADRQAPLPRPAAVAGTGSSASSSASA